MYIIVYYLMCPLYFIYNAGRLQCWRCSCVYTCQRDIISSRSAKFFVHLRCLAPGMIWGRKSEVTTRKFRNPDVFWKAALEVRQQAGERHNLIIWWKLTGQHTWWWIHRSESVILSLPLNLLLDKVRFIGGGLVPLCFPHISVEHML